MSTDHVKIQVRKGTNGGSPGCLSYPAHGGAESGGTIFSAKAHINDKLLGKTPEQRKCGPDTVLTSQVHVFAQYSFTYKYRDLGLTTNPAYYNAAVVA